MSDEDTNRELKNAIFAAKTAAERHHQSPGGEQFSGPQQSAREQLAIELPVADVPLPSLGLVYPEGHALHGAEYVAIKGMTAKEEDILMNRTLVRRGTVISELIKSCVLDKNLDVTDLISGDRNALMVAVRITGYGEEYTTKVSCPQCEVQQDFSVNLKELNLRSLDLSKLDQVSPYTNEFRFSLPVTKRVVTYKFLTGREEEKILQDLEAKKKKGIIQENLITTRLQNSVVSVDGHTARDVVARFCQNMPARDSLALRKHIDNNEPTVDMTSDFCCSIPDCGHQEVIAVPMGTSFFWG